MQNWNEAFIFPLPNKEHISLLLPRGATMLAIVCKKHLLKTDPLQEVLLLPKGVCAVA